MKYLCLYQGHLTFKQTIHLLIWLKYSQKNTFTLLWQSFFGDWSVHKSELKSCKEIWQKRRSALNWVDITFIWRNFIELFVASTFSKKI